MLKKFQIRLDPRAEFYRSAEKYWGIVDGDHPIMNGEPQRLATHDDKPGDRAIFYVAHDAGWLTGTLCAAANWSLGEDGLGRGGR